MPRLLSSDNIINILRKNNFVFVSQKGSHVKYSSLGHNKRTIIVPTNRKEIPIGTLHSIIRQSGLPKDFFRKI